MNRPSATPCPAEKQRLRDAISRHINHYLARGGKIQRIDAPQQQRRTERFMSPWRKGQDPDDFLLD